MSEPGRPSLADEVRAILERPAEIERMVTELVRLADENRVATTGRSIEQPVQDFMHDRLLELAEHPPTPAQGEWDRQLAQLIGQPDPQHETVLESSLYAAQHSPERSEMLNELADRSESAYDAYQQTLMAEMDHSHDIDLMEPSRSDYSFDR